MPTPSNEVVVIAQEIAMAMRGSPEYWCRPEYQKLAERIYCRLLKEQEAAIKARLNPDD